MKFWGENEKDFCRIENCYGIAGLGTPERIMEMIDTCGKYNAQILNDHRVPKAVKQQEETFNQYRNYDERNPRLDYEYDVEADIYSRSDRPAIRLRRRQG